MDSMMNTVLTESIHKEEKMLKKWDDQKRKTLEKAGKSVKVPKPVPYQSAPLNFLDQSLGLIKNPHDLALPSVERDPAPGAMLRWGVSREGQGRDAFLRLNTKTGGPHERYGRAATSAQEVGWTSKRVTAYTSSPFARKPLIKQAFYRPMGVSFSTGTL
eukprot:TRINITY_DN126853_c0_g1_i1.p1 TRINITY_DN126853_c0_g1~~TRINITY_DN126853_c0_g1_i1.p1  ORF type:complete len:159 (+),score=19.89 TRINITY_DN126853_c0_g1_i1:116-592(+)